MKALFNGKEFNLDDSSSKEQFFFELQLVYSQEELAEFLNLHTAKELDDEYNSGKDNGYDEGYDEGYADGKSE